MKNIYVKRKCLNQKVPMVSIPKIMLDALNVKTGNTLRLTLNHKTNCIEIRKEEDSDD